MCGTIDPGRTYDDYLVLLAKLGMTSTAEPLHSVADSATVESAAKPLQSVADSAASGATPTETS
jgi:hypothetical protein